MRTDQVFGISPEVREFSYVDRGNLDSEMFMLLKRSTHVAIRGPSKSGKSWLRQAVLSNPIVIQCRLQRPYTDIYVNALSQLNIKLQVKESRQGLFKANLSAIGDVGRALLLKAGLSVSLGRDTTKTSEYCVIGHDINDLHFIANIIKASKRRLVIEDFHYMSTTDRRNFAFDLKALWDYGVFVVIIGIWSETNLMLHLNPDLTGRVTEIPVDWSRKDLLRVLRKGERKLNLQLSQGIKDLLVSLSYCNAGLLQQLTLLTLDEAKFFKKRGSKQKIDDIFFVEAASMVYAEHLNPVYQQLAKRVSAGVRKRKNSTGIYAHAMAAISEASDNELIKGLHAKVIFRRIIIRQERIQYGNLKAVLSKLNGLQVDDDGRGLMIEYNESTGEITVVDRTLLLYRRFTTVKWPWEDMIQEADACGGQIEAE